MPQDQEKPPLTWGGSQRSLRDPSSFGNKPSAPLKTPAKPIETAPPKMAPLSPSAQKMQRDADKALAAKRKEMAKFAKPIETPTKVKLRPRRRARSK